MILKTLSLENIRSYKQAHISFPKGSILLSGDVGSGKTTILLAIEFALFGIMRGELSASSLLRYGTKKGSVTLTCEIDKKDYVITRTLVRDNQEGVKQGSGTITSNEAEEKCTPIELRAKILELLGYSHELLTRAKSLVFRYTVYTPQEDMKKILFEGVDTRLETLRNVFGIERFKQIKDNTANLQKELRLEEKALTMQLEELPHKEKEYSTLLKDEEKVRKHLEQVIEEEKLKKENYQKAKEEAEKDEAHLIKKNSLMQELTRNKALIQGKEAQKKQVETQAEALEKRKEQNKNKEQINHEEKIALIKEHIQKIDIACTKIQEKIVQAQEKHTTANTEKNAQEKHLQKANSLKGKCPTCEQEIDEEHKKELKKEYEEEITKQNKIITQMKTFLEEAQKKKKEYDTKKEEKQNEHLRLLQAEQKQKQEKEEEERIIKELTQIAKEKERLEKEIIEIKNKTIEEEKTLKGLEENTKDYEEKKKKMQETQRELQNISIERARTQEEIKGKELLKEKLNKEISRLKTYQKRKSTISLTNTWLTHYFLAATNKVENAVFSSIHHEFKELFKHYFTNLLPDEHIEVNLDESFSPIISLQGYDTEIQALSGGEKTAVALAYRLALNQVINEFLSTIKTRDLLILDEPTDGFSSNQLDSLQETLHTLKLQQIIIVSHENKMESFVEHIIRIEKTSDSSTISS